MDNGNLSFVYKRVCIENCDVKTVYLEDKIKIKEKYK